MDLNKENEERYHDFIHGLISQIEERISSEPGKSIGVDIMVPTLGYNHIRKFYIDEKTFPRVVISGEDEDQYFDIFTPNDLLIIIGKL